MSEDKGDKPKIIVDSDWKEQAAREKEKLAEEAAPTEKRELPPADFVTHCASLATQAMIIMGAIAFVVALAALVTRVQIQVIREVDDDGSGGEM